MSKFSKYIKYVKSWEDDPNLKEWIAPMAGDIKSAFCKVCRKPLHAHKKDLLLHSKAKKHCANLERYKSLFSSCQPLKDADIGDGSYEFIPNEVHVKQESFPSRQTPKKKVTIAVYPESQEIIDEDDILRTLGDEETDTASIVISDDLTSISRNPLHQLKNIPEYRGWLEVEDERISCKVCCKDIKPSKTEIMKHSTGKLHQKKCCKKGFSNPSFNDDVRLSFLYRQESLNREQRVLDLRSDTVTQPSKGMKEAMLNAEVGDDALGDDPIVIELEEKVAQYLEKEKGLLVPSGTMANLIAVLTHCYNRDSEAIIGDESHLNRWSQGGLARMGGIQAKPIKNQPDGTFSITALKELLNNNANSPWVIQTLVCIENPHSRMGGRPLPLEWLRELGTFCLERGLLLHMDGARILNASICCGVSPADLVRDCASSTFCLNKGLGSPIGSVLVGSQEFIERAKRIRTMLGGTMHQAGIFAAAGLYSLDNVAPKIRWDHANARAIAQAVKDIHSTAVTVDLENTRTNFVHLHTDNIRVNAKELCERLSMIKEKEYHEIGGEIKVMMMPVTDTIVRFVTHYDLSKCDINMVIRKLNLVIGEYDNMLDLNFDRK